MTNRRQTESDLLPDDADPLIDALLAEFVPTEKRKRGVPPDLTAQIMAQLALLPTTPSSAIDDVSRGKNDSGPIPVIRSVGKHAVKKRSSDASSNASLVEQRKSRLPKLVSMVVAMAVCLLAMFWIDHQYGGPSEGSPGASELAESSLVDTPANDQILQGADATSNQIASSGSDDGSEKVKLKVIVKAIPLVLLEAVAQSQEDASDSMLPNKSLPVTRSVVAVETIAKVTSETARQYWESLGIEPTPAAPADLVSKRFSTQLGITVPVETIGDTKALGQFLSAPSRSREIAKRWLASVSDRSLREVGSPERQTLVKELGRAVSGEVRFDTTLVSLIDGSDEQSKTWYETIGKGGHQRTANHLAAVAMNAEMRCVRCHDSMIGRSGTQDDYWSFVALVQSALSPAKKPVFYELPDGRQSLASPKVSAGLADNGTGFEVFSQWTQSLVDSPQLAASMVDSLWSLVHGRKLRPSPVDAFAPPMDNALNRLHQQLADDLRSSGFNVARTLALIMSSPMANRSVPQALQAEAVLTTTDEQRLEALEKVAAYGAAISAPSSSRSQRLDLVMRRLGQRLDGGDQAAILAQPIQATPGAKKMSGSSSTTHVISFEQQLGVDLPGDVSPLPVSWLRSIKDFDEQTRHLAYLSGHHSLPKDVQKVAELLKKSDNPSASLGRLWWILRD